MKMMKENRGLTLVELVITIAIVAIVIAAATSFMITGSRSFAKGSADSDLQKEAELTVNQIEDMIIDANGADGGLEVNDETDAEGNKTKTELVIYHTTEEPDESGAMETKHVVEKVVWDKNSNNNQMFYSKSYADGSMTSGDQLFAENVSFFEVDVDKVDETASDGTVHHIVRSVQIRVGYENSTGRVDYATSPVITLRNRMFLGGDLAFDEPPKGSANMSLYYSGIETGGTLEIIDKYSPVQRGNLYDIYALLENGTNINHLVNWEIEETNRSSTIDSNGLLTVFPNEPNEYLTIIARYKTNPNKYEKRAVKVEGGNAKNFSVTVFPESLQAFAPVFGSYVNSPGYTQEEVNRFTYSWDLRMLDPKEESKKSALDRVQIPDGRNKSNIKLTVNQEDDNYGKVIRLTLTVTSPDTLEQDSDYIDYVIDDKGTLGDSYMRRGMVLGGEVGSDIFFAFETEHADYVEWDWYFCDKDGRKLSTHDQLKDHVKVDFCEANRAHFDYVLSYDEELPLNQEYYVRIIAYLKDDKGTTWTWDRIHYIPAVQLFDYHWYTTSDWGNFECTFGMVGYYDVALQKNPEVLTQIIGVKIEEFDVEAEGGVTVTPKIPTYINANNTAETYNRMRMGGQLEHNFQGGNQKLFFNHLKLKVYMKQYPDVYTYVDVYFSGRDVWGRERVED